jgi:hypothetical protein
MTGRLRQLLAEAPLSRRPEDYEAVFDDYVAFAGGHRVTDTIRIPPDTQNADYLLENPEWDCVVELKQVSKYEHGRTVDRYFAELYRQGLLRAVENLGSGKIRITPQSLSHDQWMAFYDKFRPGVADAIEQANRQTRATLRLLPQSTKRRLSGVIILNSGDYSLPTDLLFRFIERKTKKEWRANHLRSIDFVICQSIDLFHPEQHPLHGRAIARPDADDILKHGVFEIFEQWVAYVNAELGTQVQVRQDDETAGMVNAVDRAFIGKLRLS